MNYWRLMRDYRVWDRKLQKMTYFSLYQIRGMEEHFFCNDKLNNTVLLHMEHTKRATRWRLMHRLFNIPHPWQAEFEDGCEFEPVFDLDIIKWNGRKYIVEHISHMKGVELAFDDRFAECNDNAEYIRVPHYEIEHFVKLGNVFEHSELLTKEYCEWYKEGFKDADFLYWQDDNE